MEYISVGMWAHLGFRERVGYAVLGAIVLFVLGFVGTRNMRAHAPIVFEGKGIQTEPAEVVTHVAGAVKNPGLVRMPPGSRAADAIHMAGGALASADLDSINLAARLIDGSQLYVPYKGTDADVQEVGGPFRGGKDAPNRYSRASALPREARSHSTHHSRSKQPQGPVHLNTATAEQLQTLPGIGPATAAKILEYRKLHGPFRFADDIMAIRGIGPSKLEKMRPWLRL